MCFALFTHLFLLACGLGGLVQLESESVQVFFESSWLFFSLPFPFPDRRQTQIRSVMSAASWCPRQPARQRTEEEHCNGRSNTTAMQPLQPSTTTKARSRRWARRTRSRRRPRLHTAARVGVPVTSGPQAAGHRNLTGVQATAAHCLSSADDW